MRVIGIDPGTAIVGYGIVDYEENNYKLVKYGIIETHKDLKMEDRLLIIYKELSKIIEEYGANEIAIEELFYFKNNKTVISVGQARGVIILVAKLFDKNIANYTPLQVKMGICGYGRAEKKQVQQMVQRILKLEEIPKPDDAADALAIAITHINTLNSGMNFSVDISSLKKLKDIKNKISAKEYRELILNKVK